MSGAPVSDGNNVEDIKKSIDTSIEIFIHTTEDIQKVTDAMPKVGQLKGAQKIHELVFESDGKMWQKNLPSENFYKPTRIKIGREMVRSTAENALDEIDEDVSDFD